MVKPTPEERFWAKVEKTEGCWNWTAAKDRDGYGQFKLDGRMRPAHRVAYEWAVGPIPDGLGIDHRCHVHGCVRPDHLRTATAGQNNENQAGAYANNQHGVRGVSWHKRAKKWSVRASHEGRVVYGGLFVSKAEAEAVAIAIRNGLFTYNELDRQANVLALANKDEIRTAQG